MKNSTESLQTEKFILSLQILLIVFTVFSNLTIVITVIVKKEKTFSNCIFLSIALSDCIVGAIPMTFYALIYNFGYWPFGDSMCLLWVILDFSSCSISVYSSIVVSVHRLRQLILPYKTKEEMNLRRTILLVAIWLITFSIFTSIMVSLKSQLLQNNQCEVNYEFSFVIAIDICAFLLPISILICINIAIIFALKKKNRIFTVDSDNSKNRVSCPRSATKNATATIARSKSSENRFKAISKTRRAYFCVLSISLTLLSCWTLFIVTWPIKIKCAECVHVKLFEIAYWLTYLTSAINPIILICFNDNFQKIYYFIFHKIKIKGL